MMIFLLYFCGLSDFSFGIIDINIIGRVFILASLMAVGSIKLFPNCKIGIKFSMLISGTNGKKPMHDNTILNTNKIKLTLVIESIPLLI